MFTSYDAGYTVALPIPGGTSPLLVHRTTSKRQVVLTSLCTEEIRSTVTARVATNALDGLKQFGSIGVLPARGGPLHVWARTCQVAAGRGTLVSMLGAVVGACGLFTVLPMAIAGGVLGGVVGGYIQFQPLRTTELMDKFIGKISKLAQRACWAPHAEELENIRDRLLELAIEARSEGLEPQSLVLCAELDALLDAEQRRWARAAQ